MCEASASASRNGQQQQVAKFEPEKIMARRYGRVKAECKFGGKFFFLNCSKCFKNDAKVVGRRLTQTLTGPAYQ